MDEKKTAHHGKQPNQKIKPYVVLQYLMKVTDENHVVSATDIISFLEECGITAPLHNPHFEANENALRYGTAAHVAYAFAFLSHKGPIPFQGFQGDFDAFLKHREME